MRSSNGNPTVGVQMMFFDVFDPNPQGESLIVTMPVAVVPK